MNMEELGRVVAHLITYRTIESHPDTRRFREDEKELADILLQATPEDFQCLSDFFRARGLRVVEVDNRINPTAGLKAGARVHMLIRQASALSKPTLFGKAIGHLAVQLKGDANDGVAKVWFVTLWLLHMELIYTGQGRPTSDVQGYVDARFDLDVFIDLVRRFVREEVTPILSDVDDDVIGRTLANERGEDIPKRCRQFVAQMIDTGLLVEVSKEQRQYRQSLLSAREISETYSSTLGRLGVEAADDIFQRSKKILTGGLPAGEGA